jgi:hypothetical protein
MKAMPQECAVKNTPEAMSGVPHLPVGATNLWPVGYGKSIQDVYENPPFPTHNASPTGGSR